MSSNAKGSEAETDPAVIERNIEHTRQDMTETLDAIQQRLEPEQVTAYVKEVAHYVILEAKDAVRDLAGQASGAIREAKSKTAEQTTTGMGMPAPHGQQNRGGGQDQQSQGGVAAQMQEKAGLVTGKMQEKSGQVSEQMRQKAETMQQQGQGLWQMVKGNPVAFGALGVAVGGLVAALVPATQKENQLMGETRD
ncbi:MAG: DUF3618 domain-containing protein, partial [Chloroflexia bacterium]|nr:DUF3618 domain-containing protein [Chloroflexia bacterium]